MISSPKHGIHISLEGVSGCGKSFLLTLLREELQEALVTVIEEIEDRQGHGFDLDLLSLLRKSGDRFFRSGYPRADTLLLLALLAHDTQQYIEPALASGQIVLEDRSVDTVAVYQALIMHPVAPEETVLTEASRLYTLACQWHHLPDLTFLLIDDFTTTAQRAQERSAEAYQPEEMALLRRAYLLYDRYAQAHADRIIRLDRRVLDNDAIIAQMKTTILAKYAEGEPLL